MLSSLPRIYHISIPASPFRKQCAIKFRRKVGNFSILGRIFFAAARMANPQIRRFAKKSRCAAGICVSRLKNAGDGNLDEFSDQLKYQARRARDASHTALLTQASRGIHAAASPLPSGNLASRYSAKIRQTSIADKIPASLPRRTTIADPMWRNAISAVTSLSGVLNDTT